MTTARHGVKAHYETECIERMTKWLKSIGWNDQEAQRGAVQISLVLCGDYSRAAAREASHEIAGEQLMQASAVGSANRQPSGLKQNEIGSAMGSSPKPAPMQRSPVELESTDQTELHRNARQ